MANDPRNFPPRKLLVTCALPYANGSIHLGHMLEHIQADIWVRYQRLRGNIVNFICADDAHGTPIMLKAQQMGMSPEEMIAAVSIEHQKDFAGFDISFDNYHSTHSDENRELASHIYLQLEKKWVYFKPHYFSAVRPRKRDVPTRSFCEGNVSEV